MSEEITLSPGQLAWKKLRQHKSAMFGLYVIVAAMLLAVFCYVLVPDNSPDSNAMSLQISLLPPGSSVDFLKTPRPENEQPSFLSRLFSGKPLRYNLIPVASWRTVNDTIYYEEYVGDATVKGEVNKMVLSGSGYDGTKLSEEEVIVRRTFWLGTDRFGRDLLSRLIVATRISLSVGLIAVVISLVIGISLGALAGYFRGTTDRIIVWFINVIWSIPTLLLVVAITMALGKGFIQVFIAVGLTMWVEVARLVRGQFFSLRELQFVEAGKALGYKNGRIMMKHILPNIMGPVIVIAASNFASAILLEAGLSFLGMGAQPPTPSWGMMIKENYSYIVVDAAWLALFPGGAIALMVLSFTLLGNGLRDAFDTKV